MLKAVDAVLDELGPAVEGLDASDQRLVDATLNETDGTENKKRTGANAILGVSLAVAKAAADSADLPLFRYLGGPNAHVLPVPALNVINGGEHADNGIEMQEFFLVPHGAETFSESLRWGAETYQVLKKELLAGGFATGLGDEGGFAPDLPNNREALDFLMASIERAGFTPGKDIAVGLDVASTEFFSDGKYRFEGKDMTSEELTKYYEELVANYPLVTIEDALAEDDWEGWSALTAAIGDKVQLVGDDLFVTNPERLARGIKDGVANSLLVKVNQIGTLTETFDAVSMAQNAGYTAMMSHRSGETEDTTIADLLRRGELRSDQVGRARSQRPCREVQSASADRRGARWRGGVRRSRRLPAIRGLMHTKALTEGGADEHIGSPFPFVRTRVARQAPTVGLHHDHARARGAGRARAGADRVDLRRTAPEDRRTRGVGAADAERDRRARGRTAALGRRGVHHGAGPRAAVLHQAGRGAVPDRERPRRVRAAAGRRAHQR